MKRYGWAFLIVFGLLSACGGDSDDGKGRWGRGNRGPTQDPLVEVVPVLRANISRFERSNGRISARELADVYAQVTEVATSVRVEVGDRVRKGDILARLDRETLEIEVNSSMLNVLESELAHRQNQLDAEKRKTDLDRILRYFDPDRPEESSLFSKDAYDTALLEYNKAANAVQSSRIELTRAQGALAAAQLQLANTIIRAPITGVVTERIIRANELVTANSLAFRIADFRVLEVALDVAESSLTEIFEPDRLPAISMFGLGEKVQLESAQAVLLAVQAFQGARFLGYVDRVSPVVDEARGMVKVFVRIIQPAALNENLHEPLLSQLDPDSRDAVVETAARVADGERLMLRPGNWVDAHIATHVERDVLLVPGAALVGDSEVIWVIEPGDEPDRGTARRVDVSRRRGITSEGSFQLLEHAGGAPAGVEIEEGTLIVVRGQSLLRENQKVRVRDISK